MGTNPPSESSATPLSDMQQVIDRYGPWTAMSIHLGDGQYTRPPTHPDRRLVRFLRIVADLARKPIAELRVLDLACLEGHYAIEFARQGAQVLAIEIREAHVQKARYVQQRLGLVNLQICQDDVRNLSRAKYGTFDVVICSGILYHLSAEHVFPFLQRLCEVCDHMAIIDTHVSLQDRATVEHEGHTYHGLHYTEHEEHATQQERTADPWASADNTTSFWPTHASLCNALAHVGFTSLYECWNPAMPRLYQDRKAYIAIKGPPLRVLTSPITDQAPLADWPEQRPWRSDPVHAHLQPSRPPVRPRLLRRLLDVLRRSRGGT